MSRSNVSDRLVADQGHELHRLFDALWAWHHARKQWLNSQVIETASMLMCVGARLQLRLYSKWTQD